MTPQSLIASSSMIVIKIGSALLVDAERGGVRQAWLAALAEDIMALRGQGKSVVVVSSGAIGLGRKALGIDHNAPSSSILLEKKQAAAAVGQIALMQAYINVFGLHGATVGQVLLTPYDTENRRSHLNARATIHAMLAAGILPVINENDTVSTAEIRFGDNDRLASRVAQMVGADLVVQLSTTDGLYTADPRVEPDAEHVPLVERLGPEYLAMAGDALPGVSTGGMKSKLVAARIASESGVHMMIAKGVEAHALKNVAEGMARATVFLASDQKRTARKRWILAHVKPGGKLVIDDGAKNALLSGKSLLPAGVRSVAGEFDRGDAVQVCNADGDILATGIAAYDSEQAAKIMGRKSAEIADILGYSRGDEIIHRDDLVLNG